MTKRESKVRAADQIVRLNPDIFGDVILRASDISLLIDTAGLILEVIYNTENKNLGNIEHKTLSKTCLDVDLFQPSPKEIKNLLKVN